MAIRILDAATIGKISAGEVVERPSSAAKELIENAIDAGATSVTVEIRDGGVSYLRVTDNGCGIPFPEAKMAFENHATSKLKNADGLWDIRTLGFRGEALPSIAAVSRVTMTTRVKNADFGAKVRIEGGSFVSVSETGCPEGTTIVMEDIFYNLPVRRSFLKKPSYEQGLISDLAQRMILGNPSVAFRLISNGKTLFRSCGDGDARNAALSVFGREYARNLRAIDAAEGAFAIRGLIGVGDQARPTRNQQCFFMNGRLIRCPLLSQALEEACRGRVTVGMYPMCALSVTTPAEAVDVNVHPSKLEVRFRDESAFRLTAQSLLNKAFTGERMMESFSAPKAPEPAANTVERIHPPKAAPDSERKPIPDIPGEPTAKLPKETDPARADSAGLEKDKLTSRERPGDLRSELPKETDPARADSAGLEKNASAPRERPGDLWSELPKRASAVREGGFLPFGYGKTDASSAARGEDAKEPASKKSDPRPEQTSFPAEAVPAKEREYRLIGALFNTYILLESGENFIMIDQHAAHERLNFEKYRKMLDEGNGSQQLMVPYVIHVSRREAGVLMDNRELLREAGYEVEPFGDTDVQVRAVPFVMGQADMRMLFTELIESLDTLRSAEREKRMTGIMQASCKHAVKAGDRLTDSEIRALLSAMAESDAPPTCPHGRPVLRVMTKREIERMFKRVQ